MFPYPRKRFKSILTLGPPNTVYFSPFLLYWINLDMLLFSYPEHEEEMKIHLFGKEAWERWQLCMQQNAK